MHQDEDRRAARPHRRAQLFNQFVVESIVAVFARAGSEAFAGGGEKELVHQAYRERGTRSAHPREAVGPMKPGLALRVLGDVDGSVQANQTRHLHRL